MLNKFQQISCSTFKPHEELASIDARFLDWCLGLSGEVGEVTELFKHHIFHGEKLDKMELAKELGDILWYVAAVATTAEMDLNDIAELNMAKLQHRHGTSFNANGSATRHVRELAFKETPAYMRIKARLMHEDAPLNVIFIGPDGAGKTTITRDVAEALGFAYHKCDYHQAARPQLGELLLRSQTNVVYDRFYFPDDQVYSAVKKSELSPEDQEAYIYVASLLMESNTIFVYIDAELETLQKRSGVWIDDYVMTNDLPSIQEHYRQWIGVYEQAFPILRYDTTDIDVNGAEYRELIATIIGDIKEVGQRYYSTQSIKEVK